MLIAGQKVSNVHPVKIFHKLHAVDEVTAHSRSFSDSPRFIRHPALTTSGPWLVHNLSFFYIVALLLLSKCVEFEQRDVGKKFKPRKHMLLCDINVRQIY